MNTNTRSVLFFSRGRGRGHAVPDLAIAEELPRFSGYDDIRFVSYATGADTLRAAGRKVIDLGLPDHATYTAVLEKAHAVIAADDSPLVIAHEEFAVLAAARLLGRRSVLLTDWFPSPNSVAYESLRFADSVVFIGDPGIFPLPAGIRAPISYVGPVIRKMAWDRTQRLAARRALGLGAGEFVVSVIPGAWATESRAPLAPLLFEAFARMERPERTMFWLSRADAALLQAKPANGGKIVVMADCRCVEQVMVASDVVVTKGNRGTILEAAALGIPSVSLSHRQNPIDEILVGRIKSNIALHVEALDAGMLAAYLLAAATPEFTDGLRPLEPHLLGGAAAASALATEMWRLAAATTSGGAPVVASCAA